MQFFLLLLQNADLAVLPYRFPNSMALNIALLQYKCHFKCEHIQTADAVPFTGFSKTNSVTHNPLHRNKTGSQTFPTSASLSQIPK